MFKKFLSAAVALCIFCTLLTPLAMAKSSFSDVISPDYDWAVDEIEQMTKIGIIKGYTDGTFRPASSVKKIEALLFMARAAGFENEDYQPFASFAETLYSPALDDYNLGSYNDYKPEVAFLLYKGVLSVSDLEDYLESPASALKRYEAAILLTKLMGAEDEINKNTDVTLSYEDFTEIPVDARAYVEYVTHEGLMRGIEDNNFGPNDDVTRVQMTLLLSRILKALDYTTMVGTVRNVDAEKGIITIYSEDDLSSEEYAVKSKSVTIICDGLESDLSEVKEDSTALLLYSGENLVGLEVLSPVSDAEDEIFSGHLADISEKANYISFYVIDNKTGESREFMIPAKNGPEITYDGKSSRFSDLNEGDYVTVTLENGTVVAIDGESDEENESGIVRDIALSPDYTITVRLNDEDGEATNETVTYEVDGDVSVNRNGRKASLDDVRIGDSVELVLSGGIVTEIEATSIKSSASGTITSILISDTSGVTIRIGGVEHEYAFSADAVYFVDDKDASIYDLRLGARVDVELEGDSITEISVAASSSTYQITGIIDSINTNYGFINLDMDGEIEKIYVSKTGTSASATIIDSTTGKNISFSKLAPDQTITAVGSYVNGKFVATTIMVIPEIN